MEFYGFHDLWETHIVRRLRGREVVALGMTCTALLWLLKKDSVWRLLCEAEGVTLMHRSSWKSTYVEQCAFLESSSVAKRRTHGVLQSAWRWITRQRDSGAELQINVSGMQDSGKTTLLYALLNHLPRHVLTNEIPTIGISLECLRCEGELFMRSWDEGGSDKIRPIFRPWLLSAHGLVWVLRSSDLSELDEARKPASAIQVKWTSSSLARSKRDFFQHILPEMPENRPVLFVANFADLPGLSVEDLVSIFEVGSWKTRPWRFEVCSQSDITGLLRGIRWLRYLAHLA